MIAMIRTRNLVRLESMSETRRLAYGAAAMIVGVAINRYAGLNIVLHSLRGLLSPAHVVWVALFTLGYLLGGLVPLWYWVVRPLVVDWQHEGSMRV